ncbi:MAG TPA: site-specific integrase [Firmicutes bacterium]|nr:site-specific integrase [Bacillota bacterium]
MPGHLEKRSKSSWTIVIDLGHDPATGKRKRLKRAFRGTKKEAEQELARLLVELEKGTHVEPARMTVAEYLVSWLEAHGPNLAPSTLDSYRRIVTKHLVPALGTIPLAKLLPLHLQTYYADALAAGLSPRTVLYHHRVLREALQHAVKWQMVPRNVADSVDPPRPRRPDVKVLDPASVQILLKTAEGHRDYALIHTAVYTGLRRGELVALRWSDVDLERGVLYVRQSMIRLGGRFVFREPKTQKGRRQVVLPKAAVAVLKAHKRQQAESRLRLGPDYQDHDLVFCNPDGRPLDPGEVSHRFATIARKASFPGLRFHDLRHTHATLLLAQGVHPKVVQERLGHENISTTLDTYSHVLPSLQEQAAARLDDLLSAGGHQLGTNLNEKRPGRPAADGENP